MKASTVTTATVVALVGLALWAYTAKKNAGQSDGSGNTTIIERGQGDTAQPDVVLNFGAPPATSIFNMPSFAFPIINVVSQNPSNNRLPTEPYENNYMINFLIGGSEGSYFGDILTILSFGDMVFGGSENNIDLGDFIFGDTNIDARITLPESEGGSCNVCAGPEPEALMPYVPNIAAEIVAANQPAPDPPAIINTVVTGNNRRMAFLPVARGFTYGPA